jgi:hypothetical protein
MLNFVKGIFCVYWDDNVIFVLYSVYVLYWLSCYWFSCVESSLQAQSETTSITEYDHFLCVVRFGIRFENVYWEMLHLCSS